MANLIDQLVVELVLDPSKFNQGQRQTLQAMRSFTQGARVSSHQIQHLFNVNFGANYARAWANRTAAAQRGLMGLAAAGRAAAGAIGGGTGGGGIGGGGGIAGGVAGGGGRGLVPAMTAGITGAQRLGAAAGVGAAGLRQIAAAGLAAYAALKVAQGAFAGFVAGTWGPAQLGRTAQMAGVVPQWLGAFELWAQTFGAVPERVGQTVLGLQQSIQRLQAGQGMDQTLQNLVRYGAPGIQEDIRQGNIPQIIAKAIEGAEKYGPGNIPLQTQILGLEGFDPSLIPALLQGAPAMQRGITNFSQYAPTPDQINRYQQLWTQIYTTADAFDALSRAVLGANITDLIDEGLRKLTAFMNELRSDPAALKDIQVGLEVIGAIIGVTLVDKLAKLTLAMTRFAIAPAFTTLSAFIALVGSPIAAGSILAGLLLLFSSKSTGSVAEQEAEKKLGDAARAAAGLSPSPKGTPTPPSHGGPSEGGTPPDDPLARRLWEWWYGVTPGSETNLGFPTSASGQTYTRDQLQSIGQQAAEQYGVPWDVFNKQIQAESGWRVDPGVSKAGALGIAQFLPSTAAGFGIDPMDPKAALYAAAYYDAQLKKKRGTWVGALTGYSGGLTPEHPGDYGSAFDAAQRAQLAGIPGPQSLNLPTVPNYVKLAQQGNSSIDNSSVNTTMHNYGDTTSSVGPVIINAPTGNGRDIASQLSIAVRNNSLVDMSNTGLS